MKYVVKTEGIESKNKITATVFNAKVLAEENSLVRVLVLDPQPVINSFLTNSFVIKPAIERDKTITSFI